MASTVEPIADDLPGADLVRAGLADLGRGEASIAGLLVLCARERLTAAGISVAPVAVADPGRELYLRLERADGSGAYAKYNALRRRLVAFCEALEHDARRRNR